MTLDLSVLALLVLAAFLSGWLAARRSPATAVGAQADRLRRNYFRGLNYLLNEQPDKAIEVFLQIAEVDDVVEALRAQELPQRFAIVSAQPLVCHDDRIHSFFIQQPQTLFDKIGV